MIRVTITSINWSIYVFGLVPGTKTMNNKPGVNAAALTLRTIMPLEPKKRVNRDEWKKVRCAVIPKMSVSVRYAT